MKYAIVRINGEQYKAIEGKEILVKKVEGEKVTPEVLFVNNEKSVKVGQPLVKGAKIELKKLGDEKGKKVSVLKYKSKSRYRKRIGTRPEYSRFEVVKVA